MDKSEYHFQLIQILNLAHQVQQLKITDVLRAMIRAETVGPILNPTTHVKAATSLEWQKRTAEAALRFQQAIKEIVSNPRYSHSPTERKTQ